MKEEVVGLGVDTVVQILDEKLPSLSRGGVHFGVHIVLVLVLELHTLLMYRFSRSFGSLLHVHDLCLWVRVTSGVFEQQATTKE